MALLILLLFCVGAGLVVSAARVVVVGDDPHCRACGFNLAGIDLAPQTATCPECGCTPLNRVNVVRGARHHRARRLWIGLPLLVLAGALLTARGSWTAWNASKPLSLLKLDANVGTSAIRDAATGEIMSRWRQGQLSIAERRGLVPLAVRRMQPGPSMDLVWLEFLSNGSADGIVSDAAWASAEKSVLSLGQTAAGFLVVQYPFRSLDIGFDDGPLTRAPYLGYPTETMSEVLTVPGCENLTLLFALKSVSIEGQPIALLDQRAFYETVLQHTPDVTITAISMQQPSFNGQPEPMLNAPRELVPPEMTHDFQRTALLTPGIRHIDLPPGRHAGEATWTAFVGYDTTSSSDPWGSPNRPTVFGPFEFTKAITFDYFDEPSDVMRPIQSPDETRQAESAFRSGYEIIEVRITPSSQVAGYAECSIEIQELDPKFHPQISGVFELDIAGQRFPVLDTPPRVRRDGSIGEGMEKYLCRPPDFVSNRRRSLRNPWWVQWSDLTPESCDLVFVPDLKSGVAMQHFDWSTSVTGEPAELIGNEVRWENVPITYED